MAHGYRKDGKEPEHIYCAPEYIYHADVRLLTGLPRTALRPRSPRVITRPHRQHAAQIQAKLKELNLAAYSVTDVADEKDFCELWYDGTGLHDLSKFWEWYYAAIVSGELDRDCIEPMILRNIDNQYGPKV